MGFLKAHKILIGIIILSFCASLIYSFVYQIRPVIDAEAYDKIAVNLINGFGFKENNQLDYKYDPGILRAGPGYEFFLAGVYKIFGHSFWPVWLIQAILHALTAFIVYQIARQLFDQDKEAIGLIAAAFIGFHPDLIEISAMLMTETLYLFFISWLIYLFVRSYQNPDKKTLPVWLGFITALAILCRPTVVLFAPIIVVAYLYQRKFDNTILFALPLLAGLAPWVVRNYLVYRQFVLTTMIGEYNLWVGNTLTSNGGQFSDGYNFATGYADANGYFGFKAHAREQFRNFIFNEPAAFIKLCFIRTVRYFSLIRPMGFWFYQTGLKQMLFIISSGAAIAGLFVAGFAGLVAALKEKKSLYYFFILLAVTSPATLVLSVVQSRYRFQIYPFLAILAGYCLVNWRKRAPGIGKIIVGTAVVMLVVSLVDVLGNTATVLERIGRFI